MNNCLIPTLFSIATLTATSSLAAPVDLNTWTAESYPSVSTFGNGIWTVNGGGDSVTQSVNGQPTLYYSDFNAQGTAVTGTIRNNGSSDDDYIGFVLGFQPGDSSNAAADYLLLDWKRNDQYYDFGQTNDGPPTTAVRGLALSRVTGIPTANEFWGHNDYALNTSGAVTELARGETLGNTPYNFFQDYNFSFDFGPNNLVVNVDGVQQFNIAGSFSNGRLGFYNFSQANVVYSAFEVEEGSFPNSEVPLPASGLLILAGLGALAVAKRRKEAS